MKKLKVSKKVDPIRVLLEWMGEMENLQDELYLSLRRLGIAVWVLLLFQVVVTYAILVK